MTAYNFVQVAFMADVNKYAYIAIKEDGHAVAKLHIGGKIQSKMLRVTKHWGHRQMQQRRGVYN